MAKKVISRLTAITEQSEEKAKKRKKLDIETPLEKRNKKPTYSDKYEEELIRQLFEEEVKKAAEKNRAENVKGVYDGAVVNATIENLKPNTTYYIRACAMNGFGRTSTETVSAKTPPRIPAMDDNNFPTID